MSKKLRHQLYKIVLSALFYILAWFSSSSLFIILCCAISYLIAGSNILKKTIKNLRTYQLFDENFLMTIATIGAWILGEYTEAVAVMLLFQIGEFFQTYAVGQSRKEISTLMSIRPDFACIKKGNKLIKTSPDKVNIGDTIVIGVGERVPLDALVSKGDSLLDTSALTGESAPLEVTKGDKIISGCINTHSVIEARVTSLYRESTVNKILNLVENASSCKSSSENFITRFSRYYTPVVVILAFALVLIPTLISPNDWEVWTYRALTFLVISCPCALVISVPLSFFGGIGAASKQGILVKGSNYLEMMSGIKNMIFDKTGTLTTGTLKVNKIVSPKLSPQKLLELATLAEAHSTHPIAQALRNAWGKKIDYKHIHSISELGGLGIKAIIKDDTIILGSAHIMNIEGINIPKLHTSQTIIFIAINNTYAGYITISDTLKPNAQIALSSLYKQGIQRVAILTGDNKHTTTKIAQKLGIKEIYAGLLPQDKVNKLQSIIKQSSPFQTAFVGDGINDAPVLACADVGITFGGIGSDAAIEASDIVIMGDDLQKLAQIMCISRQTVRIVHQNIIFALSVKAGVMLLGSLGFIYMWAAIFADVGVSFLAILNAMRALRAK